MTDLSNLIIDVTNVTIPPNHNLGIGQPNQLPPQIPTQAPPVYATREDQQTQATQLNQQTAQQQWNAYGQQQKNAANQLNQMSNAPQQNPNAGQTLNNMVNSVGSNRLHNQLQNRHSDTDAMLGDNDDECMGGGNFSNLTGLGVLNGNNPLSANYNRMRQLQQWTQQSNMGLRSTQQSGWRRLSTFLAVIIAVVIVGFIVLSPLFHYFM